MRFSVIIVTWNGKLLLERFLPSVSATSHPSYEILIADNASTDGTSHLLSAFPVCRHVLLDRNYGYCGGNNRAAAVARGEWLVFLNNDVRVPPDWLEKMDLFLREYPQTGIAQPVLKSESDPGVFEYAGASGGFLDVFGYPFCRGRIFDVCETDKMQYPSAEAISWASGAVFFIKKSLFEQLGGFEEVFEFHMEEIDLCWRAWRAGTTVAICPTAEVFHLGGGSLATGTYRKWFYNIRNSLFLLTRNLPQAQWLPMVFLRMVLDGIMALRFLVQGNTVVLTAVLFAHFDLYRKAALVFKWRRQLTKTGKNNMPFFHGLLPFHFFVRKKRTFDVLAGQINRTPLTRT